MLFDFRPVITNSNKVLDAQFHNHLHTTKTHILVKFIRVGFGAVEHVTISVQKVVPALLKSVAAKIIF